MLNKQFLGFIILLLSSQVIGTTLPTANHLVAKNDKKISMTPVNVNDLHENNCQIVAKNKKKKKLTMKKLTMKKSRLNFIKGIENFFITHIPRGLLFCLVNFILCVAYFTCFIVMNIYVTGHSLYRQRFYAPLQLGRCSHKICSLC